MGGLELLVSLLRAPQLEVVTAAAAAVARMATEDETLAVLSDHHVVTLLASLVRHVRFSLMNLTLFNEICHQEVNGIC